MPKLPPAVASLVRVGPSTARLSNRGLISIVGPQATDWLNGILASTVPNPPTGHFFTAILQAHASTTPSRSVFYYLLTSGFLLRSSRVEFSTMRSSITIQHQMGISSNTPRVLPSQTQTPKLKETLRLHHRSSNTSNNSCFVQKSRFVTSRTSTTYGPPGAPDTKHPGRPRGIGDGQRGAIFPNSYGRKAIHPGERNPCC